MIKWARWQLDGWRDAHAQEGPWHCDCPKCDYTATSRWYLLALAKVWLHIIRKARRW